MCAFNRTVSKVDTFLKKEAKGTKVIGARSLEDMVSKLKKPRRVMMLVKAGSAVDDFINKLVSILKSSIKVMKFTLQICMGPWRDLREISHMTMYKGHQ